MKKIFKQISDIIFGITTIPAKTNKDTILFKFIFLLLVIVVVWSIVEIILNL